VSRQLPVRWPDRLIIGVTGNIATGKSAVMRMAADKGALTLDADKVVHHIMDNDASMQAAIAVAFGGEVRREDGSINRARLASIVFNDPAALRDLEQMLHPAVRAEIIDAIRHSNSQFVFIEAIKLLEGSLKDECDQIWVTNCTRLRQIERLMICRGLDDESAVMRVDAQNPQAEKVAQADVVIETDGTLAETRDQSELAWEQLPDLLAAKREGLPDAPVIEEVIDARLADEPEPEHPEAEVTGEVQVRRARPSDVPAILLLMHQASQDKVSIKRADLLMAMSDRSYLIGQIDLDIRAVVGFAVEGGLARIEEIHLHPEVGAVQIGAAVMREVEKSANEHICEVIVAFPDQNAPSRVLTLLKEAAFVRRPLSGAPEAWKRALRNAPLNGDVFWARMLRDVRVK
jgi:dephospho-CoA kinase